MGAVDYGNITLIPQGTAYGLLIGLAVLFCCVILIAVKLQKVYLEEDSGESEMFMVANRTVGTGLTASAVFSSWMWINETVSSALNCYRFGLSAPMVLCPKLINMSITDDCIVVWIGPLLPNRSDGRDGRSVQDPCALRAHFARDRTHAVRTDRAYCFYLLEPYSEHFRMLQHDPDRLPIDQWYFGNALCGGNHSCSVGRLVPITKPERNERKLIE